jgi:transcriptional regulator with XRE-family HTH domain
MNLDNLNKRIGFALENSSLNQAEFARRIDKSEASVSRWLSGETSPRGRATIANIAETLHVSEDWLEFGIGEMRSKIRADKEINSQNQGSDHTDPVAKARLSIDQLGESLSAYTSQGLRSDDPQRLIELAEMLLRTARELMKNK